MLSPGVDAEQVVEQSRAIEPVAAVGEPSLCVVARQQPEKGTDVLLRALPAVARELPEVGLIVVGIGEELEANQQLAVDLGIADRVSFIGLVPNAAPHMAAADIVVLPSRREGLPIVALEALSLARPVVATRVGGTPTVVVPGRDGLARARRRTRHLWRRRSSSAGRIRPRRPVAAGPARRWSRSGSASSRCTTGIEVLLLELAKPSARREL